MSAQSAGSNAHVTIVVLDHARLSSVALGIDAIDFANDFLKSPGTNLQEFRINSRTISESGRPIRLAHGVPYSVDGGLKPYSASRGIFIPAFKFDPSDLSAFAAAHATVIDWLIDQYRDGAVIAASGAASMLLAASGLIDQGIVALPDQVQPFIKRHHPDVHLAPANSVVEHRRLISAGTASQERELIHRLLSRIFSPSNALWVANATGLSLSDTESTLNDTPFSAGSVVARAQQWLRERYAQKLETAELARELAMSQRTLLRRFASEVGQSPHQYIKHVRMEAAKRLILRTEKTIAEIANIVGYTDLKHFRSLFRQYTGNSPAKFKAAARGCALSGGEINIRLGEVSAD